MVNRRTSLAFKSSMSNGILDPFGTSGGKSIGEGVTGKSDLMHSNKDFKKNVFHKRTMATNLKPVANID